MALINGTSGNDVLIGTNDNDTINGGAGNDIIDGRLGLDVMDAGTGVDTLDVTFWNSAYELDMTSGLTNFAGETAVNFENINTGAGNDRIVGNSENNIINTGAGDDWIDGGLGLDVMDAGTGVDTLDVTFWNNAYELDMTSGLTNFAGETAVNFENVNTGAGNDRITGTTGANVITTGNGNDVIMAGAGNDILNAYGNFANGSVQIDQLHGGTGNDVFVLGTNTGGVFYNEVGEGYAVIQDWRLHSGMVFEDDRVQLTGNASQYQIVQTNNVVGTGAVDTEIYCVSGMSFERIGVIQDSTDFALNSSYVNWV
ncbi:hypothetical protein IFO70_27245 [Phormidium tenue FACHB-886]|nr:hypothetical protein [Phormidium tenue FACHB-886]